MSSVADDFVRYIMHMQVAIEPAPQPQIANVQYSAPDDPVQGSAAMAGGAAAAVALGGGGAPPREADEPVIQQPVVRTEWEKTGRNDPCPCGSGKKFKVCHGR